MDREESVDDVLNDMQCVKLTVSDNRFSCGKNDHEPQQIDITPFFQDYVKRVKGAIQRQGELDRKPVRRNLDRFDRWDDAYDAWQKECVLPHPDAVACTNEGKCMRMVWLFAEWLWKPAEK